MRRVRDAEGAGAKVEHYRPRARYPDRELAWQNLLLACDGGETTQGPRTCDTSKGDRDLLIDPLTASVDAISYRADGHLGVAPGSPRQAELERDINETLNLNATQLVAARSAALDALQQALRRNFGDGRWSARQLQSLRDKLRDRRELAEYFGVWEYWINRFAKRK